MKKYLMTLLLLYTPFTTAFSQQALMTQLQQPDNIQGEFRQQRFLKSLPHPIRSSGKFTLIKAQGLLWQMQKPFAVDLRVNDKGIGQWNGTAWVVSDKLGQSQQVKLFLGLLSGDVAALKNQFDLNLSGSEQNWQLTLTPSSLLMRQIFERIDIRGDAVVKQIELQEKQGDRSVITFEQVQLNQPLSAFVQTALQ